MEKREKTGGEGNPCCQEAFGLATIEALIPRQIAELLPPEDYRACATAVCQKLTSAAFEKHVAQIADKIRKEQPDIPEDLLHFRTWEALHTDFGICTRRGIHPFLPVEGEVDGRIATYETRKAADSLIDFRGLAKAAVKSLMLEAHALRMVQDSPFARINGTSMDALALGEQLTADSRRIVLGLEILASGRTPEGIEPFADEKAMPGQKPTALQGCNIRNQIAARISQFFAAFMIIPDMLESFC